MSILGATGGLVAALVAGALWLVHWVKQQAAQKAAAVAEKARIEEQLQVINSDVTKVEGEKDAYIKQVGAFLSSDDSSKSGNGSKPDSK